MNFPIKIAKRYLFAKKSTNAINIISGISVFGITIGTAALVIVLSVFNGFEDLLTKLFGDFNPDIKISIKEGKVFEADSAKIAQINQIDGVFAVSKTLEEIAFFEYTENQKTGIIKGVDNQFIDVNDVDSTIIEGDFLLKKNRIPYAVIGSVLAWQMNVNIQNDFEQLTVFMAKKDPPKIGSPFKKMFVRPAGVYKIQQEFDSRYVLVDLDFAQSLLDYSKNEISSIEVKISSDASDEAIRQQISNIMGEDFYVKNRYQQDEAFLKLMNIEKWLFYSLFTFMIIIIAFNMIGALWMMVMEKRKDVAILKSMGARDQVILKVFLNQGLILCGIGILSGFVLAIILYILQKTVGIITIPQGFVVDTYPVEIRFFDFIKVGMTVLLIGGLAAILPARKAAQIPATIQEE